MGVKHLKGALFCSRTRSHYFLICMALLHCPVPGVSPPFLPCFDSFLQTDVYVASPKHLCIKTSCSRVSKENYPPSQQSTCQSLRSSGWRGVERLDSLLPALYR